MGKTKKRQAKRAAVEAARVLVAGGLRIVGVETAGIGVFGLDEADEDLVVPHPDAAIGGPGGKAAVLLVEDGVLNFRPGGGGRGLGMGRQGAADTEGKGEEGGSNREGLHGRGWMCGGGRRGAASAAGVEMIAAGVAGSVVGESTVFAKTF